MNVIYCKVCKCAQYGDGDTCSWCEDRMEDEVDHSMQFDQIRKMLCVLTMENRDEA